MVAIPVALCILAVVAQTAIGINAEQLEGPRGQSEMTKLCESLDVVVRDAECDKDGQSGVLRSELQCRCRRSASSAR